MRVRSEIGRGAEQKRNGVRCENVRSVDDTSQALIENRSEYDNSESEQERSVIAGHNRANGVTVKEQENPHRTKDARIDGKEGNANGKRQNSDSRIAEERQTVVDIVQHLVESR